MLATNPNEKKYLTLLKELVEGGIAPEVTGYCFKRYQGGTPFSGEHKDESHGKVIIEMMKVLKENKGLLPPPFAGNLDFCIELTESLRCNYKIRPVDVRNLYSGKGVPKYVVDTCARVFNEYRSTFYADARTLRESQEAY